MTKTDGNGGSRAGVLLFDGACPFCSREAEWLKRADVDRHIRFVDISDPSFDAAVYGVSRDEVEAQLHFWDEAGHIHRAMDAVRAAYRAVGRGRRLAWTGWPLIRPVFDRFYRLFARNRVRWGRWLMRRGRRSPCARGEPGKGN